MVRRPPIEKGFMRGGWFAWPDKPYNCVDCGTEVHTTNSGGSRCAKCGKDHLREVRKLWKQAQRKKQQEIRRRNERERAKHKRALASPATPR
jgi:DNA-directed RNA polymerase subunit RPC12/RpoP